jgi:hypothetical protein
VQLRYLGKESQPNNSPTLFETVRGSFVVQGWVVTDPDVLSRVAVAAEETIVEVPPKLMVHLAQAGLAGDVTNLTDPIVHVTAVGNYIIRGRRVTDSEALEQMTIPDHETCVEVTRSAVAALIGG